MRKGIRFLLLSLLAGMALTAGACAARDTGAPSVRVWESGGYREIPISRFNERAYLERGYIKNTDAEGNTLYVLIPSTDRPKDVTFLGGTGTGKEASFGGFDGQFTGKRTPMGILLP